MKLALNNSLLHRAQMNFYKAQMHDDVESVGDEGGDLDESSADQVQVEYTNHCCHVFVQRNWLSHPTAPSLHLPHL